MKKLFVLPIVIILFLTFSSCSSNNNPTRPPINEAPPIVENSQTVSPDNNNPTKPPTDEAFNSKSDTGLILHGPAKRSVSLNDWEFHIIGEPFEEDLGNGWKGFLYTLGFKNATNSIQIGPDIIVGLLGSSVKLEMTDGTSYDGGLVRNRDGIIQVGTKNNGTYIPGLLYKGSHKSSLGDCSNGYDLDYQQFVVGFRVGATLQPKTLSIGNGQTLDVSRTPQLNYPGKLPNEAFSQVGQTFFSTIGLAVKLTEVKKDGNTFRFTFAGESGSPSEEIRNPILSVQVIGDDGFAYFNCDTIKFGIGETIGPRQKRDVSVEITLPEGVKGVYGFATVDHEAVTLIGL